MEKFKKRVQYLIRDVKVLLKEDIEDEGVFTGVFLPAVTAVAIAFLVTMTISALHS